MQMDGKWVAGAHVTAAGAIAQGHNGGLSGAFSDLYLLAQWHELCFDCQSGRH
jgi:hypothetical protein